MRELDTAHLRRVNGARLEFFDRLAPHDRPVIAEHRAEVSAVLDGAAALVVAGGHVGVLAEVLHLFNVAAALNGAPVIAWSAGAMALTDRIVLFGDRSPRGPGHAEVYGSGLSLLRDVVLLPHARSPAAARRHGPDGGLRPAVRPGPVRAAGGRHPDRRVRRRRLAARRPGPRRGRARDRVGGGVTASEAA